MFPFITSLRPLLLDEEVSTIYATQDSQWRESFVAHHVEDFLAAAGPYVSPLERMEVDGYSIYYAILAEVSHENSRKLLCVTVVSHGAGRNSLSFLLRDQKLQWCTFFSRTCQLIGTRALEVAFVEGLEDASAGFLKSKAISLIVNHANSLFYRLVTPPDMNSILHLSWWLALPDRPFSPHTEMVAPLLRMDSEYMRTGQMCNLKGDYCLSRGNEMPGATIPDIGSSSNTYTEYTLMFDSTILETYLCIMEHRFVRRAGISDNLSHQLGLQWIQKMEARLSAEKLATLERHHEMGSPALCCNNGNTFWFALYQHTMYRNYKYCASTGHVYSNYCMVLATPPHWYSNPSTLNLRGVSTRRRFVLF
ncbi:hypothetical protein PM082_023642 [Marasmius tenuissimus]|nr:hypothetical protein PM082_023642 [Marasmius tenuissimus]